MHNGPGFLRACGQSGSARALLDAGTGEWFTYAQLRERAAAFAEALNLPEKAAGVLFARNDAESVIAYLALLEAGHAVVTLDAAMPPELQARLIARFQPRYIIHPVDRPCSNTGEYLAVPCPHAGQRILRAREQTHAVHAELALLLSTSGSTGSPKLVRLAWRNLEANARMINRALGTSERDCAILTSPMFHGLGQSFLHTHLLAGGSVVVMRQRAVSAEFWKAARDAGCNTIGGTPYFYEMLDRLDLTGLNVPALKRFVQTGGRLPERLARKFDAAAKVRGGALHLMYGQAEATARISGLPPEYLPEAARSVGFPLEGGRLSVEGEDGELIFEGPNVMMGYAECAADLARGDELGGRVATGDLGYRDERGLFYITGRRSRFAKVFGWRVSLDDIEEMLSAHGPVAARERDGRIVIYAEREPGHMAEAVDALARTTRLHPAAFEVRQVASVPRLPNGKTDYTRLPAQA